MSAVAQTSAAQAERLELRLLTTGLLRFLLPDGTPPEHLGRYRLLTSVLQERPALRAAVVAGDVDATRRAWADTLRERADDITLLHCLAVLYHEQASIRSAAGDTNEGYWVVGTALWVLVLSSERFWASFWEDRPDGVDREQLLDECFQSALTTHGVTGRREFLAGGRGQARARVHLRCLDLCRSGEPALTEALAQYGAVCDLRVDKARLDRAAKLAGHLIDEWAKSLVREAERKNEDPEELQRLPEGLRKNYSGAIDHLQPFIDLGVAEVSVLRATVAWYNDWCYDLYVTKQIDQIKRLMVRATKVADRLAPMCTKANSYRPENAALSQHFLLRGFVRDDAERAIEEYKTALAWDLSNVNAEKLLQDQARDVRMGQVRTATECSENKKWREAYRILDEIEAKAHADDLDELNQARALILFNHAQAVASDGEYRSGLKLAQKALKLTPGHPVVTELVRELGRLASEEPNMRCLREARAAFEADRYDDAIRAAAKVPERSTLHGQARDLMAAAHFYRGVDHANGGRFDKGIADLEAAAKLVGDPEYRRHIESQLAAIREATRGHALGEAIQNQDWDAAEWLLRQMLEPRKLPKAERQQLQSQLSMVLMAHAVDLVNRSQTYEKRFGEALTDILEKLRRRPEVR